MRPEPERTCVGCRGKGAKRDLVRVARSPGGPVRIDPGGKVPGRGAYVHRDPGCWDAALRRGALARALRTSLDPREVGNLLRDLEGASRR